MNKTLLSLILCGLVLLSGQVLALAETRILSSSYTVGSSTATAVLTYECLANNGADWYKINGKSSFSQTPCTVTTRAGGIRADGTSGEVDITEVYTGCYNIIDNNDGKVIFQTWISSLSSGTGSTTILSLKSVTLQKDATAPVFSGSATVYTKQSSWVPGDATLDWVDPQTGIDTASRKWDLYQDGQSASVLSSDAQGTVKLADGQYRVVERICNGAGIMGGMVYSLIVDTAAPVLTWKGYKNALGASPVDGLSTWLDGSSTLVLDLKASDSGTGVSSGYSLDGGKTYTVLDSSFGLSSEHCFSFVMRGQSWYELRESGLVPCPSGVVLIKAFDLAGNTCTVDSALNLAEYFDTQAPTISYLKADGIASAALIVSQARKILFSWYATDNRCLFSSLFSCPEAQSYLTLGTDADAASQAMAQTASLDASLPDGSYDFALSIMDQAGNSSHASVTLMKDTEAPLVALTLSGTGAGKKVGTIGSLDALWWRTAPSLEMTASDKTSGLGSTKVRLYRMTGLNTAGEASWGEINLEDWYILSGSVFTARKILPDGLYKCTGQAWDKGNLSTLKEALFCVDAAIPQVRLELVPCYKGADNRSYVAPDAAMELGFAESGGSAFAHPELDIQAFSAWAASGIDPDPEDWKALALTASSSGSVTANLGTILASKADGAWSLRFAMPDKAGNAAELRTCVIIDASPPDLCLDSAVYISAQGTLPQGIDLTGIGGTDTGSGVSDLTWTMHIDNGAAVSFVPADGQASISDSPGGLGLAALSEGRHILYLNLSDHVGNQAQKAMPFIIDRTKPAAALWGETLPGTWTKGLAFGVRVTDTIDALGRNCLSSGITGLKAVCEGMETSPEQEPALVSAAYAEGSIWQFGLPEGKTTWQFAPLDTSGNSSVLAAVFLADRTPPVLDIQAPAWLGMGLTIHLDAQDEPKSPGLETSGIDGQTWESRLEHQDGTKSSPWTPGQNHGVAGAGVAGSAEYALPDGPYLVSAHVSDKAGNKGLAIPRPLILDRTPPACTSFELPSWCSNTEVLVHLVMTDNSTRLYQNLFQGSSAQKQFLSRGGIGKPRIKIIPRIDGSSSLFKDCLNESCLATWTQKSGDSDPVLYRYVDFQTDQASERFISDIAFDPQGLKEGSHVLELEVLDEAGQTGVFSKTFRVDRSSPSLALKAILDDQGHTRTAGSYLPGSTGKLVLDCLDTYVNGQDLAEGSLGCIEFSSSAGPLAVPDSVHKEAGQVIVRQVLDPTGSIKDLTLDFQAPQGFEHTWLWIRLTDQAGNPAGLPSGLSHAWDLVSIPGTSWLRLGLLHDQGVLQPPRIQCLSGLPRAERPEDARSTRNALFILSPGATSSSGLGYWTTKLYRITKDPGASVPAAVHLVSFDGQGHEITPSGTTGLTMDLAQQGTTALVALYGLPDNLAQDYYLLEAAMVSETGKTGPASQYCFRIDTVPPGEFRLALDQGACLPDWQNSPRLVCSWTRPVDLSGVEAYYWRLDSQKEAASPDVWDAPGTSLESFARTQTRSAVIALDKVLGTPSGSWVLTLIARDYADNRQVCQIQGQFDLAAPDFPADPAIRATPQTLPGDWVISCRAGMDLPESGASGLSLATLELVNLSSGSFEPERRLVYSLEKAALDPSPQDGEVIEDLVTVGSDGKSLTHAALPANRMVAAGSRWNLHLRGLHDNSRYFLRLVLWDQAGNCREENHVFDAGTVDTAALSPVIPLDTTLGGYRIRGEWNPLAQTARATLTLGTQPSFRRILALPGSSAPAWPDPAGLGPELASLESQETELTLVSGRLKVFAHAEAAGLLAGLQGWEIWGSGLELDQDEGLRIKAGRIKLDAILNLGTVNLGTAAMPLLSSEAADLASLSRMAANLSLAASTAAPRDFPFAAQALALDSPKSCKLQNGFLEVQGGSLDLSAIWNRLGWSCSGALLSSSASLDASRALVFSDLRGTAYEIKTPSVTHRIISARLEDHLLLVSQGSFVMDYRGSRREIPLRNYGINLLDGSFIAFADFSGTLESLLLEDGSLVLPAGLGLDSQGRLSLDGEIQSSDASVRHSFGGLVLGQSGPDWTEDSPLESFTMNLDGFTLVGLDQVLCAQGIQVRRGMIQIQGRNLEFRGLVTDLASRRVLGAGTVQILDSFVWACGYPYPVRVKTLSLESQGVIGSAQTSLPPFLGGGTMDLEFLRFQPGAVHTLDSAPALAKDMVCSGWSIHTAAQSFDGSKVEILEISLGWQDTDTAVQLSFPGLSWGAAGITPACSSQVQELKRGGFAMVSGLFVLDDQGLSARMDLLGEAWQLPDGNPATLGRLCINPDASWSRNTGALAQDARLPVRGWTMRSSQALLKLTGGLWQLVAPQCQVEVDPAQVDAFLGCSGLVMDSSGQILKLQGSLGITSPRLIKIPGCITLEATAWQVLPSGIACTGTLEAELDQGDGSTTCFRCDLGGATFLLHPDLSITTPVLGESFGLVWQGWNGTCTDVSFDALGINLGKVTLPSQVEGLSALDFVNFRFRRDGTQANPGVLESSGSFNYQGWLVDIEDAQLGEDGLHISGGINLPEALGGQSISVQRMDISSAGQVAASLSLNRFLMEIDNLKLALENLHWSAQGLQVERARLELPAELESASLDLSGLYVGSGGELSLASLRLSPLKILGMEFCLENLSIQAGTVSAQGTVTLPDKLPGELAGLTLCLQALRFTAKGELLECTVKADASWRFELFEGFWVSVGGLGFSWENGMCLTMDQALLGFPAEIPLESVAVSGLRIDLDDGSVAFADIAVNNLVIERDGLTFALSQGRFSQDGTLSLSGFVKVPRTGLDNLGDLTLEVHRFEILPGGLIGAVDASLSLPDFDLGEGMVVEGATGRISRDSAGDFCFGIAGTLVLGGSFPQGIANTRLVLEDFLMSASQGKILSLKAHGGPVHAVLDGGIVLEDLACALDYQDAGKSEACLSAGSLAIQGTLVLPQNFPEALRGGRISLEGFECALDGTVRKLDASLSLRGTQPLGEGLEVKDARLGFSYRDNAPRFSLSGSLSLGPQFPQGLAGASMDLKTCVLDQYGCFTDLDAALNLGSFTLCDSMEVREAGLSMYKNAQGSLEFGLKGRVILPSGFPQGLAGKSIAISRFTLDQGGRVTDLSITLANLECRLFDSLNLTGGAISLTLEDQDLVPGLGGTISLPQDLPGSLGGASLELADFRVSGTRGILSASVRLVSPLDFEVFAGIQARVSTLGLDSQGVVVAGSVTLPASFPQGLAGMVLSLQTCKVGWDGTLLDISAGIGATNFQLAGFGCSIQKLMFSPSGIALESALITLPPGLGSLSGTSIGLRNVGWDTQGNFHGEIVTPQLDLDLAGFTLSLKEPGLDLDKRKITFGQVTLTLPEVLGSACIGVTGVSLSPEGARISGVKAALPDFEIPGGLQFKGIGVEICLDGDSYYISGSGGAWLPGAGGFDAQVSFTNQSTAYPIGLKRAYFQYTLACPGLAIGTTGLYLSSMRGGIAFGPPDEVPQGARWLFESETGIRLQLGLTVADASGELVQGKVDTWVDVEHFSWALQGQISFLKSSLNFQASVLAAISSKGFYAGVEVMIVFIEGRVELYIFDENRKTYVSATGSVNVFIPKNAFLGIFPLERTKLASVGMEIGTFRNGKSGARGWLDLGIFGTLWAFVDDQGFACDGIESYQLTLPSGVQRSVSPGLALSRDTATTQAGSELEAAYTFQSPQGARNLVVMALWKEGCPWLELHSPDGRVYAMDSPELKVEAREGAVVLAMPNPQPGMWSIQASGVLAESGLQLSAFGARPLARLSVTAPALDIPLRGEDFSVQGTCSLPGAGIILRAKETGSTSPGQLLGTAQADSQGRWSFQAQSRGLGAGRYALIAELQVSASAYPARTEAPGKLVVSHPNQPLAPEITRVSWLSPTQILVEFQDANKSRTQNREIWLDQGQGGHWWSVGLVERIIYPVLPVSHKDAQGNAVYPGLDLALRVCDQEGRLSSQSRTYHLAMPAAQSGSTSPGWQFSVQGKVPVLVAEEGACIKVRVVPQNSLAPYTLSLDGLTPGLNADFPVQSFCGTQDLEIPLRVGAGCPPGSYRLGIRAVAAQDYQLSSTWSQVVETSLPEPVLQSLEPSRVLPEHLADPDFRVLVRGRGFLPGSLATVDGQLCSVEGMANTSLWLKLPEDLKPGSHILALSNPAGKKTELSFQVEASWWEVQALQASLELRAGETGLMHFRLEGRNNPQAALVLRLTDPQGYCRMESSESASSALEPAWAVSVPDNLPPGIYSLAWNTLDGPASWDLASGQAGTVELRVVTQPSLSIQAMSARTLVPSQELQIYGSGFDCGDGETLQALVDDTSWPIVRTSPNRITVQVPQNASSGGFKLQKRSSQGICQVSATWPVFVQRFYLRLEPARTTVELESGTTAFLDLSVLGISPEATSLSVRVFRDAPGLDSSRQPADLPQVTLSETLLQKPGPVVLRIQAPNSAGSTCIVQVKAQSGRFNAISNLSVHVIGSLAIATDSLPEAVQDSPYEFCFQARRKGPSTASQEGIWALDSGRLPDGLALDATGLLHGQPGSSGTWRFRIRLEEPGRPDEALDSRWFTLAVTDSAWGFVKADAGASMGKDVELPAQDWIGWTQNLPQSLGMIASSGIIFVRSSQGITALSRNSGRKLWTKKIPVTDWAYAGDRLFVLGSDASLRIMDGPSGSICSQRELVRAMSVRDSLAVLWQDHETVAVDVLSGTTRLFPPAPFAQEDSLWFQGELYGWKGTILYRMGQEGFQNIRECSSPIRASAADSQGLWLFLESGSLQRLARQTLLAAGDPDWQASLPGGVSPGAAVSTQGNYVAAGAAGRIWLWDIASAYCIKELQADQLGICKDFLVLGKKDQVTVLNRYSLETLWTHSFASQVTQFISVGQDLYVLCQDGSITQFRGPSNRDAPQARAWAANLEVPADTYWYTQKPAFRISASDRETWAREIQWNLDGKGWRTSKFSAKSMVGKKEASVKLPALGQGLHRLSFRAVDSKGMGSSVEVKNFGIDLEGPKISWGSGRMDCPDFTWSKEPIHLLPRVTDRISGVARQEYQLDNLPWTDLGPSLRIVQEGRHTLRIRAWDRAGNLSESSHEWGLDRSLPQASFTVHAQGGNTWISVSSKDLISGIQTVHYQVDGEGERIYRQAFTLTPGHHVVRVWARDRAGNRGPLQCRDVFAGPGYGSLQVKQGKGQLKPGSILSNDGKPMELLLQPCPAKLVRWSWRLDWKPAGIPAAPLDKKYSDQSLGGIVDDTASGWISLAEGVLIVPWLGGTHAVDLRAQVIDSFGRVTETYQESYQLADPVDRNLAPGLKDRKGRP